LIPLAISSISYDPFGKYLLLLVRNNIVYIYNSISLGKVSEVALSPKAETLENINTVKETRNMGWSPDFNYLVCPSLDDSRISLAINLCRSNNFKVQNVFYGHVSSISCAKFSPNLYEFEGQPTSIVAIGDSHGVVSLWRVGAKVYDKPLLICNSKEEYHEVVEELEWNQAGDTLFANMMKRYINVLVFDKASFGR
jgi:WD40 repeat protein